VNNLPKVVAQQRHGRASNPRLLDRKSDALPLSHCATPNTTFGDRSFAAAVSNVRKSLSDCVRDSSLSENVFAERLKSFLIN